MPEVRKNDAPLPQLTFEQLSNVLMVSPWLTQWPGSAGTCRLEQDKIVVAYVEDVATDQMLQQVALRLNTENKVPKNQIAFESHKKRLI